MVEVPLSLQHLTWEIHHWWMEFHCLPLHHLSACLSAWWQRPIYRFHLRWHLIPRVLSLTEGNGYDYWRRFHRQCDVLRSQCRLQADVSFVINEGWGVGRLPNNHFSDWPTWLYILCTSVTITLFSQVEKSHVLLIFVYVLSTQSYNNKRHFSCYSI